MGYLGVGLLLTTLAVGVFVYAVNVSPVDRIPAERRQYGEKEDKPVLTMTSDYLVKTVDRLLRQHDWVPFGSRELELAGLRVTPASMVVTVVLFSISTAIAAATLTGSVLLAVVPAALVPVIAKVYVKVRTTRRQKAFADQLDGTIQMIAAALRAGHSFASALDAVSHDAETPTAEEFGRVVNENRIGRDLVVALEQTSERMESEDFRWIAEAVAVHRDTGGNLNEVLDRVGQTMRERNQVRQQVNALAAEGKLSAIILMILPVLLTGFYVVFNPTYISPLFTSNIGRLLLAVSIVMYIIGGLWMRKIVNVKF